MCPPPALLKTPGKSFCPALGMFISHLSATPEEQNVIMALKAGKTFDRFGRFRAAWSLPRGAYTRFILQCESASRLN
jgi:hypothetical protein